MGNGKKARKCPLMKKLNYDCALEAAAYATAKRCLSAETTTSNENWFKIAAATATNKKLAAQEAVKSWYAEITKGYMEQSTGSLNMLKPTLNITHFARMVWGKNDKIGCGVFKCNKDWHVVCQYGPGVGKLGDQIYFPGGVPCNQCIGKCENNALCL